MNSNYLRQIGYPGARMIHALLLLGMVCGASLSGALRAQDIVISEFLASNGSGLNDEDGDSSDWIEVHNRSGQEINLAGFALTDAQELPRKWTFPDTPMGIDARLVVFASGKDRSVAGRELHTNFQLNTTGEYLGLIDSTGAVKTEFNPYPEQYEDVSYGRGVVTSRRIELGLNAPCRWLIPSAETPGWQDLEFDDSGWSSASAGIGYDTAFGEDSYLGLIGADGNIRTEMRGVNATCYARFPFSLEGTPAIERMILGMKYDDGFVAYLNGVEVARDLAPNVPSFASEAINARSEPDVFEWNDFDLGDFRDLLVSGKNVLAIQGLNFGDQSSDFVILPRMVLEEVDLDAVETFGYFTEPTPAHPNAEPWDGVVGDTRFDMDRGFYTQPFQLTIATSTPEAQIWVTTDGSMPSPENGALYQGAIQISKTTVVRAAAFRDRFAPSNVDTQTYLFPADIARQQEMGDAIVDQHEDEIARAVESLPVVSLVVSPSDFFGNAGIYTNPDIEGRTAEVPVSMEYFAYEDSAAFQVDAGIRIHGGNARDHPKKPFRLYFRSEYGPGRLRFPLFPQSKVDSFDQLILRGFGH
ncbi:MAG: chitobiase/beta-hexosaminidase C-terminal domain-containing protein, partial [Verrucomicrobiae bacterium]|nr:chitobiase/beta-hexosaminidase C-terminal domain-containing protein [Verrucomicrobiae bacterium]